MKIEIDPETRDRVVRATLREDIKSLTADLKNKRLFLEDDVESWEMYLDAMKTLQGWYGK